MAEVALSVVLLVCAGLMVRTFLALQGTDSGVRADRVLIVGVPLPPEKYDTLEQAQALRPATCIERVRRLPGVEAACVGLPFGGPQTPFTIVGQNRRMTSRRLGVNLVGADHLRAFGIPLRARTDVRRGGSAARRSRRA